MSLRSLAVVARLLVGLAVPTAASASYTTGWVNLRGGAGTNYRIITTAPPGAYVAVRGCVPRWCRVTYRGITGWMSSGYISNVRRYRRPPVYYPRTYYYPRVYRYPPRVYYYPRPYYPRPYPYYGYRNPSWGFYFYGR